MLPLEAAPERGGVANLDGIFRDVMSMFDLKPPFSRFGRILCRNPFAGGCESASATLPGKPSGSVVLVAVAMLSRLKGLVEEDGKWSVDDSAKRKLLLDWSAAVMKRLKGLLDSLVDWAGL